MNAENTGNGLFLAAAAREAPTAARRRANGRLAELAEAFDARGSTAAMRHEARNLARQYGFARPRWLPAYFWHTGEDRMPRDPSWKEPND